MKINFSTNKTICITMISKYSKADTIEKKAWSCNAAPLLLLWRRSWRMRSLLFIILFFSFNLLAQIKPTTEEIVRKVADNVIANTSFMFVNNATKEKFESTKGKDTSNNVK